MDYVINILLQVIFETEGIRQQFQQYLSFSFGTCKLTETQLVQKIQHTLLDMYSN